MTEFTLPINNYIGKFSPANNQRNELEIIFKNTECHRPNFLVCIKIMEEQMEAAVLAGGNDDDVEFVILNNVLGHQRHENDVEERHNIFNLDEMPANDVKLNFRFDRDDIYRIVRVLHLPNHIRTHTRNNVSGVTGLCILLRRLAYPNRLKDLQVLFGLSAQSLSQIIRQVIVIIEDTHGHLLNNLQNLQWLNREKMEAYAEVVSTKGGAIPNCWGFIDGTARAICRPSRDQEEYYSGHKRFHCLKYQSVLCPDGIIASLQGAFPGRRHDAGIFRESNLYEQLERVAVFPNQENYVLYGDQAYGVMELLLCPYPARQEAPFHEQQFNGSMKILRIAVEWGFQKIISEFAFLDLKKNQKLLLQDVQSMYKVAVILINCHTCLYASQTSQYFTIQPPQLEEYIGV